ncbi:NACHT, LRR and PYD domains-containing protein 3-like, partial [Lithobates pipiens]
MAASASSGEKHFVDQHREKLVQQITMVHPALDRLLQEDLLTQEQCDIVKAENTSQEKMRRLLTYTRGWNTPDKDALLRALKTSNPGGTKNLAGTSLLEKLKTESDDQIRDSRTKYMMSTRQRYQRFKAYNSCRGEYVSLDKIYTQILLIKDNQHKQRREHEIQYLGRRHLHLLNDRSSSGEHSPTTPQDLFNPNEDGVTPKIVVLEGPAGIGKTMTCQKIMLDWASGNLYQDKFRLLFCLSCRELNNLTGRISLARLISRICRLPYEEEVMKAILSDSENLLFIIDGLDELRCSLEDQSEVCEDPFQETHLNVILRSLLKKQVLCEASMIITTRSFALEKLDDLIEDPRYVEALGFTGKEREEYVYKFFRDKDVAEKVLGIIKENDIVFTMCAIPITCWIVCTVMEQEIKKDFDLIQCRTTTSIYILYLKGLTKYHSRKQPVATCLRKVCTLANEGVFKKKILFEESDLRRHGLSMTEMDSVFLNESIIHQDIEISTCYSFIHLTVQEFFAALHYVLEDEPSNGNPTADTVLSHPDQYFGKSMTEMCINSPHLPLMVQFLYGLTDNNQGKELSKITGCDISFRATSAMLSWLAPDDVCFYNELICCLYEMQDEGFVRTLMSRTRSLTFRLLGRVNCIRQLAYCLKTRNEIHQISFKCWKMGLEDLQALSPFLRKCSVLQFTCYEKSSLSCEGLRSLILTPGSLKKLLLLSPRLQDSDVTLLCEGLRHPHSPLQELRFTCGLTQATCNDLRGLIRSQPETKLDVMFYVEEEMTIPE